MRTSLYRLSSEVFLMTLGSLLFHVTASAATRAVFFSGAASIPYLSTGFSDQAKIAYCSITIVNLSTTNQRVDSVSFVVPTIETTNISSSTTLISDNSEQLLVRPTSTALSSATPCIGQTLAPSSYCTVMKRVTSVPVAGIRNVHCSGKLTVSDVVAASPGAVVASGSVVTLQESVVLGGVLSAAHYYGSPNTDLVSLIAAKTTDLPSNNSSGFSSLTVSGAGSTGQMNLSCYVSCRASGETDSNCRTQCGLGRNRAASLDKYTEFSNFSGGIVHEVTIGPFLSICSGNNGYHNEGGVEFSHTEIIGLAVSGTSIDRGGSIPERLYCMHRHGNDDLYSRVGASSSFAINGGSPF